MTSTNIHNNGQYDLFLDSEPVCVHGATFHQSPETIEFCEEEYIFRAGIKGEVRASVGEYREVTGRYESLYGDKYRFTGREPHDNPWFHTADFWPHKTKSEQNMLHSIPYAALEDSNNNTRNKVYTVTYEFPHENVFAFFDLQEQRVRVFANDRDGPDRHNSKEFCESIFKPTLLLYVSQSDTYYQLTVFPTPLKNTSPIDDEQHPHVNQIDNITFTEKSPILHADSVDKTVQGDLWDIIYAISHNEEPWNTAPTHPQTESSPTGIRPQPTEIGVPSRFYLDHI